MTHLVARLFNRMSCIPLLRPSHTRSAQTLRVTSHTIPPSGKPTLISGAIDRSPRQNRIGSLSEIMHRSSILHRLQNLQEPPTLALSAFSRFRAFTFKIHVVHKRILACLARSQEKKRRFTRSDSAAPFTCLSIVGNDCSSLCRMNAV